MATDAYSFAIEAARIADDLRAEQIVVLDLRGLSPVTDFFVICNGTSDRQMRAVVDAIDEYAEKIGEKRYGVAGMDSALWILTDYVTVVIHVFEPAQRAYYDLELLWGDAPRVAWERSASA